MQVHPELARLRGVAAPQPRCDAALAAWRARSEVTAITAALARYDAGEALTALPELSRLTSDHDAAQTLIAGFIAPLIAALRAEPLAQLPLGHSTAPGIARLRLASEGHATLTLAAYARRAHSLPQSMLFEDCAAHELVVAGAGRAAVHRLHEGRLASEERALAPGTRLTRDGPDTARQIIAVTRPLLVLQLTREPAHPAPSREVALTDGRLLKTISGCKRTSQQLMALAVLGALGHRPALDEMTRLARDIGADRDLRWEALRQCLALDAARGLALLATLAGDGGDTLNAPSAALHRQLLARRPDLAALIPEPA
jgi:hypothetical protein